MIACERELLVSILTLLSSRVAAYLKTEFRDMKKIFQNNISIGFYASRREVLPLFITLVLKDFKTEKIISFL